jgi:hypothetical protein
MGLEAIGATRSPLTGAGRVVAILDTGIDKKNEAFCHLHPLRLEERDFSGEGNGDTAAPSNVVKGLVACSNTIGAPHEYFCQTVSAHLWDHGVIA